MWRSTLLAFACAALTMASASEPAPPPKAVLQASAIPQASSPPPTGWQARPDDVIEVAVTVDDLPAHGPDVPGLTRLQIHETLLQAFAKHRLPPVYGFVNAAKLVERPEHRVALETWRRAGHPLGNHTYSHPDLAAIGLDAYLADIDRNEPVLRALVSQAGGKDTEWRVFRYPYLREGTDFASREVIREHLRARGYRIAEVTIDFDDWAFNAPYARCASRGDDRALAALRETYLDNAVTNLRWADGAARELVGRPIKHILLLHVGAFDAVMIDALLTAYEKEHVRFVTLDEALADPVYLTEPKTPKAWGGNFLNQVRRGRGTRSPSLPAQPEALLAALCR